MTWAPNIVANCRAKSDTPPVPDVTKVSPAFTGRAPVIARIHRGQQPSGQVCAIQSAGPVERNERERVREHPGRIQGGDPQVEPRRPCGPSPTIDQLRPPGAWCWCLNA